MTTFNPNNPTASGMVLTFDDEFNSNSTSNDNAASGTQWSNHWWFDSPNPGAISTSNGVLNLASGGEMSSVNSAGQGFSQTYGYFEIDMKVPAGVGTWPAFFLMSQQHAVNGANPASEIDIIEAQGNQPNGYYTTLHSDTGTAGDQFNPSNTFTGNVSATPLSAGYHSFGVLWSPTSNLITYYLDGTAVATATKYSTTDYSPDMMLIDNALGDIGLGGNAPVAGQSYGPLQIDNVRVYQFASQNPTAVIAQTVSAAPGQADPAMQLSADGSAGTSGSGSSSPPPSGPATTTPSANGALVTGTTGAIVTAAHNAFAIDAAGQVTENGTALTATTGVTELAYVNGTVYQEATSQNLWWSYNEATGQWTATSNPLSTASAGTAAQAPSLGITDPSGVAGSAIPLTITAAQASTGLAASDLTVTVSNLDGATLNHGTETNGVYTLHASDLSGLTVTPAADFTGTLALNVTATDTEPSSGTSASSATQTLDVTVTAPATVAGVSANGTVVTGTTGAIVTAAHNTFAIDAAGQITENGTVQAPTNSVIELTYVNGTVYQEATSQNLWWSYDEATSQWTETGNPPTVSAGTAAQAPSLGITDPSGVAGSAIPLTIAAAQASTGLAASDLTVTVSNLDGATLNHGTEANGVYTLHASDLSGLTVTPAAGFTGTLALNVTATDTEPSSSTNASSAPQTLDVTVTAPTTVAGVSANDTVVAGPTGAIVTAAHNSFAIDAAGQITENGTVQAPTNSVTELTYVNGTVYQEATSQHLWWSYDEATSQWTETSNPLSTSGSGSSSPPSVPPAPTVSANGTVVTGTADSIVTAAHNAFAIDAAGQITENGTVQAPTNSVTELAYVNGTVYQEATSQHLWWSYNEATSQWTETSNPLAAATAGAGSSALHAVASTLAANPPGGTATAAVAVAAPATGEALMAPAYSAGTHSLYLLQSLSTGNEHIANFNPATDLLDVAPLLKLVGYTGTNPIADHVLNLEPTANGGTAVMIDPTGTSPTHGTTVITLDHVLPHSLPAADIWH